MRSPWLDGRRARQRATALVDDRPGRPGADGDAAAGPVELALAGGLTVLVVTVLLGPVTAVLGSVAAGGGALWWQRRCQRERQRQRRAQLPDALERVAGGLRSGSSLPQALAETGDATAPPLGAELTALAREAHHGQPLAELVDAWTARHDDRGTRLAATAMALSLGVGAAPARALDGVATTLRERRQLRDERRSLATQARASAAVLAAAPLAFMALFGMTDSAAGSFLLGTPPGWLCLAGGIGLDLIGAAWMARLTDPGDDR